jgi:hypothetical protein
MIFQYSGSIHLINKGITAQRAQGGRGGSVLLPLKAAWRQVTARGKNPRERAERIKRKQPYRVHHMRRAFLIFILLAVIAACGCIEGLNDGTAAPTFGPMPTAEPLPTAELLPTLQPTPTLVPTPTATPVPGSSSDPIIGTWRFLDASGNLTVYSFNSDGTFDRHDTNRGTAYSGVWERKAPETYQLIYNTPTPGIATETVTYSPSAGRMASNDTYFTRA